MSYVVIARKYRPRDFTEVVGQEAIQTTLKNAIELDRIAHAYLFTGPRGVGKTSMARIFAKSLNCKEGPTTKPCGKCHSCQEIDGGRSLDVIEIDAASNRGIDDVRAIRENIKFSPAAGKFKIYIVDEVHQVTPEGFNALLKTLEEPPAHAKFIFATTSANKIPSTVLSRCQRFDFKSIPTKTIAAHLSAIAKTEKFKIKDDAIYEVAKAGDGSLRDAESILDQIASFSKSEVTFEDVVEALGSINPEEFLEVFQAIAERSAEGVLDFIDRVIQSGREPGYFLEKCMEHVRNLMVLKVSPKLVSVIEGSDTYLTRLQEQAVLFSKEELFYIFAVLMGGAQNLKRFHLKRAPLEMTLLKCVMRESAILVRAAEEQIKNAERRLPVESVLPPVMSSAGNGVFADRVEAKNKFNDDVPATFAATTVTATATRERAVTTPAEPEVAEESQSSEEIWQKLVRRIRTEKMSAASFLQEGEVIAIGGDYVVIGFPPECSFNAEALGSEANMTLLEKHLSEILNRRIRVQFKLQEAPPGSAADQGQEPIQNPALAAALGIFGGRVVKN